MHVGGPVSGLAWCPRLDPTPDVGKSSRCSSTETHRANFHFADLICETFGLIEHLAISCFCAASATLGMTRNPGPSMIQIWSFDTSDPNEFSRRDPQSPSSATQRVRFELGLCIEAGDAWQLRWCPKGGDRRRLMDRDIELSLLGGAFEDGSISVYSVPPPSKIRQSIKGKSSDTLYSKRCKAIPEDCFLR